MTFGVPGFHLFVKPDTWWVGVQVLPSERGGHWLAVQPFPCIGVAIRWPW